MGYRNILVPLDGSKLSRQAIDEAVKISRSSGGKVTLMGVVELPVAGFEGYQEFAVNVELAEEFSRRMEEVLAGELKNLKENGIDADSLVRSGVAADEIVLAAAELKSELIVMTTHGRRGFIRFMLGSVAERVVRYAPCSVLIVRPLQ